MPDSPPPHLDYAKPVPLAWASRHKRRLIWLAVLLACSAFIYENYQPLKFRVLWMYWSHRAAHFQMPGGIDIAVTDASKAKDVLASDPNYISPAALGIFTSAKAIYYPIEWRRLYDLDPRWQTSWQKPVAFLGTLDRPDGKPRIVGIAADDLNAADILYTLDTIVISSPGLFESPSPARPQHGFTWTGYWLSSHLRSGVRDPHDSSHLTFDLIIPNVGADKHSITVPLDVFLKNDDSLLFRLLPTPEMEKLQVHISFRPELAGGYQLATIPAASR